MLYSLPNGSQITHPDLVAALAKPGDAILATLTAQKADAWHMASCIPGEAGELFEPIIATLLNDTQIDRVNLVEELGDIEFYVQGLRAIVGIEYYETSSFGAKLGAARIFNLPARAADVFDAVKKWVIYNKPLDRDAIVKALMGLEIVIASIRSMFGVTRDEVLAANVMKLGTRYATLGYSDAQAQDRADKAGTVH